MNEEKNLYRFEVQILRIYNIWGKNEEEARENLIILESIPIDANICEEVLLQ